MPKIKLIADSGSTKTEWCLLNGNRKRKFFTQGLSPYFLNHDQIVAILEAGVKKAVGKTGTDDIHFYGTGCKSAQNKRTVRSALKQAFGNAAITVEDDLTGAAKSLCGNGRGIACILGTGSNSCYYNGKKIMKNSPGLGYILGDEGSGAVLGKDIIRHYLYDLMDDGLKTRFEEKFNTTAIEILNTVYKKPLPNKYLASFVPFLAENRGNYMVENILEDGINQFFYTHLLRYREISSCPVHFTGGIAFAFKDIILSLCRAYEFRVGNIYKTPMEGLVKYHNQN